MKSSAVALAVVVCLLGNGCLAATMVRQDVEDKKYGSVVPDAIIWTFASLATFGLIELMNDERVRYNTADVPDSFLDIPKSVHMLPTAPPNINVSNTRVRATVMAITAQLNNRSIDVDSGVKPLSGRGEFSKGRDRVRYVCLVDSADDEAITISETLIAQEKRAVKDENSGERREQYREKFVRRMYRIPIANGAAPGSGSQGLNRMIRDFATQRSLAQLENEQTIAFSVRDVELTTVEDGRDSRTTAGGFTCSVVGGIVAADLRQAFERLFLLGKFNRAQ
jgi:hypothetical protein